MAYSSEEITQIEQRLAAYLAAEAAVLRNQSYQMPDGRGMTRANLAEIRAGIQELRNELDGATGTTRTRGRARRGVIL